MPTVGASSPYEIKIESVLLSSDRLNTIYEIVHNVAEINIFESINLPYLTGNILFLDTSNLLNLVNFQGTERLKIRLSINEDQTSTYVEKTFILTDIKVSPAHDTAEMMVGNMVEEHKFLDNLTTISKSFTGSPPNIIEDIMNNYLNKEVSKEISNLHNKPLNYIAPNISPLNVCMLLKDRMATPDGLPFFLYSTINSNNIYLTDLESILKSPVINNGQSYNYGQSFTRWSIDQSVFQQARNIESYSLPSAENMMMLANRGALNSTYQFIDINGGDQEIKINMDEILKGIENLPVVTQNQNGKIYDDQFKINNKRLSQLNSSHISQVLSSNSFTNNQGYYENDINSQKLSMIARSVRYYLLKSSVQIGMPGLYFLGRGDNITIGRKIIINILKNDPNILQFEEGKGLDEKRSGEYIINKCRHIIQPANYSVSVSCVKLFNQIRTA